MLAGVKAFARPRLWLGLWGLAVALVIVLSLTPPAPMPELPSGSDKVEHALAYFLLAGGAVQIIRARGAQMLIAAGLALMGLGLEFAQGAFTSDRMQDPWDALANTTGVVIGLATSWTPWADALLRLESRRR